MPVNPTRVYGISFQTDIRLLGDYLRYFECISSILSNWEQMNKQEVTLGLTLPVAADKNLTLRQQRIVALIKDGETNSTIARILGYSESLIKQETIAIFRKLGISNRYELRSS